MRLRKRLLLVHAEEQGESFIQVRDVWQRPRMFASRSESPPLFCEGNCDGQLRDAPTCQEASAIGCEFCAVFVQSFCRRKWASGGRRGKEDGSDSIDVRGDCERARAQRQSHSASLYPATDLRVCLTHTPASAPPLAESSISAWSRARRQCRSRRCAGYGGIRRNARAE